MESYLIYVPLILLYVYYTVASFDSQSLEALAGFQLADVASLLSQEQTAAAAWMHFLVIDLFTGRWIYWQGREKNIWTIHSLIICIFLCPVALLSHFVTESFFDNGNKSNSTTIVSQSETTADED